MSFRPIILLFGLIFCTNIFGQNQRSIELKPQFPTSYYAQESDKYFDTLDSFANRNSKPKYAKNVIRWEWYPWLKLTGYKSWMMKLDYFLTWYPTRVVNRHCQGFSKQPFGRCHVTFLYKGNHSPIYIYEEFTFNNKGEITFIEAWTDDKTYFPSRDPNDYWAEADSIIRLSTLVPGLGAQTGLISLKSDYFKQLAKNNSLINDLYKRLKNPIYHWTKELVRFLQKK